MGNNKSKIPSQNCKDTAAVPKKQRRLAGSTIISCEKGDIASFSAPNGAVINAANGDLKYGFGTAQALREAGGDVLDTESAQLMAAYALHNIRSLPAGGATVTGPGKMQNYKKIIQAVGPIVHGKASAEQRYRLQKAYEQIFRVAEIHGCKKLIIPFLSTGQFGFDMKEGMKIAILAVLYTLPQYGIEEVVFVNNKQKYVDMFNSVAKDMLPLELLTREHSAFILIHYCSKYQFLINQTLKDKIDKEIDELFKVTEIVLRSPLPAPVPAPIQMPIAVAKRRIPIDSQLADQPVGQLPVKRVPPVSGVVSAPVPVRPHRSQVPPTAETLFSFPPIFQELEAQRLADVARMREERERKSQEETARLAATRERNARQRDDRERGSGLASTPVPARPHSSQVSPPAPTFPSIYEEWEASRAADAARKREARARESQEDKQGRLASQRDIQRTVRANKSAEDEKRKREYDRTRIAAARAKENVRREADRKRDRKGGKAQQERKGMLSQIVESQEDSIIQFSTATLTRAERTAKREANKNKRPVEKTKEEEQYELDHPTIDVLNPKKSKVSETKEERKARLERDKKYQDMDKSDLNRPLRKEGSRFIPEQHKNYRSWIPGAFGLGSIPTCVYDGALTYTGRCCSGGRVHVPLPAEPPRFYRDLLLGNSDDAKHFRERIMQYNGAFAMGSMSCQRELIKKSNPFIKINGYVQCQIGGLRAPTDKTPLFGQIYLFDPEEAANYRMKNPLTGDSLKRHIVLQFSDFFHENNSLANQFRKIADVAKEAELKGERIGNVLFVVRAPKMSDIVGGQPLGTLTRPANELLSIMYKTDDSGAPPPKGIWVRPYQGGHMTELAYFDPSTEPMVFPLHFIYGERGYKFGDHTLFPRGTTREQAGFSEDDDYRKDTPPATPRDETPMPMEVDEPANEPIQERVEKEERMEEDNISVFSEENEDDTYYKTNEGMVPRTESPVDFAQYSDPEEEEYAIDDEEEEEGEAEAEEENASFEDDANPLLVEEPDDEAELIQIDIGTENEPMKLTETEARRNHPSRRQYVLARLQERMKKVDGKFTRRRLNLLGAATKKLSQTSIIEQYLKLLRARADFNRQYFAELRGSTKRKLTVAFEILEKKASKLGLNAGYSFRLPRSFPTSNAWFNDLYDKSMVLLIKVGGPDLFITMTGNNNWEEIVSNMPPNTDWQSNPILVCSVFHKKQQELLDDVINKELFGPVIGHAYSIEFQKRGMPHMHLLIIMKPGYKFNKEALIEKHVWARFPEVDRLPPNPSPEDKEVQEMQIRSRANVVKFNTHKPCKNDTGAYCQFHPSRDPNKVYPKCTKRFPKDFSDFTKIMPDGTVVYLRPLAIGKMMNNSEGNPTETFNEWVVTYNPYLTNKYESHINVEVVSTTHVFKYLFKYIFKGFDRAIMEMYPRLDNPDNDADGNDGTTVHPGGALLPTAAAKNDRKAEKAARRMQAHAKKDFFYYKFANERMGVESKDTGTTVNFDEAVMKETFRQTTSCEAAWGLLGFPLAGRSHNVKLLSVHEPEEDPIVFKKNEVTKAIEQIKSGNTTSPFVAYMNLMKERKKAKMYRLRKKNTATNPPPQQPSTPGFVTANTIPITAPAAAPQTDNPPSPTPSSRQSTPSCNEEDADWGEDDYDLEENDEHERLLSHGVDTSEGPTFEQLACTHHFNKKLRKWVKYDRKPARLLTMIRPVNVRKPDLFAIRLIVANVGGIGSFDEMLSYRGIKYNTFVEAAYARGLMNSQKEYEDLIRDAIIRETPYVVRRMFVNCIVYGALLNPAEIFDIKNKKDIVLGMVDRKYLFPHNDTREKKGIAAALHHIQFLLSREHFTLAQFLLPPPIDFAKLSDLEIEAAQHDTPIADYSSSNSLTEKQQKIFDTVVNCVNEGQSQCFFLQASGGCGKTFLYRKIDAELRRNGKRVTNVASTGIASTLLRNGSTAHRQFFLPLNMDENKLSSMSMESAAAEWLKNTDLIIFDEATMSDKWVYNCIDVLLQNIMDCKLPFGGKVVLLGGDWKQLLPVVTARSAEVAEDFTLLASPLWVHFMMLTLSKNIRASIDEEFAEFLEETGQGRYKGELRPYVQIDKPGVMMPSQATVLQSIYEGKLDDEEYLFNSCVLCTTNKHAEEVNRIVLAHVTGTEKVYSAVDEPFEGVGRQVPPEAFRSNMESGMPPFLLPLKKGAIVILLRNICLRDGLCNGTRLVVTEMHEKYIKVKHLDPRWKGRTHEIIRMNLTPPETPNQKPVYSRFQFPLRLAYCLTINKSQGQTFERVGILLQRNVFAHGQLYVALSRVHSFAGLKIFSRARIEGVEGVVLANEVSGSIISRMNEAIAESRKVDGSNEAISSQPTQPTERTQSTQPLKIHRPPASPPHVTRPLPDFSDIILEQSRRARPMIPIVPPPRPPIRPPVTHRPRSPLTIPTVPSGSHHLPPKDGNKKKVTEIEERAVDLPVDAMAMVESAWDEQQPGDEKLGNSGIFRSDFKTLKGRNWLNDEVINQFMDLIQIRAQNDANLPKIHSFSTFFYTNIAKGTKGCIAVRKWTKKVDIFTLNLLLIPVHVDEHWMLAVADMDNRIIQIYDSTVEEMGEDESIGKVILEYLKWQSDNKRHVPLETGWKTHFCRGIPQQDNGSDCGVFVLRYAEAVTRRAPIEFSHENMPYFRKLTVYQLLMADLSEPSSSSHLAKRPTPPQVDEYEEIEAIAPPPPSPQNSRGWLLLENRVNDCFLNASIQLLRRIRPLRGALEDWMSLIDALPRDEVTATEITLRHLAVLLSQSNLQSARNLRRSLPAVIAAIDQGDFMTSQQDASDIIRGLLLILPDEARNQMRITTNHQLRCSNKTEEACPWRNTTDESTLPFVIYNIGMNDEEVNLENLFDGEWHDEEGQLDLHCPTCCQCCQATALRGQVHDDDHCPTPACLPVKSPSQKRTRIQYSGDGEYFCITFNILHYNPVNGRYRRMDWALTANCDLRSMTMFGKRWKAVAVVKHEGEESKGWNSGHYYSFVRDENNTWWRHEDAISPAMTATEFSSERPGFQYSNNCVGMQGVTAMLFQKIQD